MSESGRRVSLPDSPQNEYFNANCKMRGLCTDPICKKLALPNVLLKLAPELEAAEPAEPPRYPHSVWLKTLNASARNSTPMLSLILKCLNRPISKFVWAGLRRKFLPALPKVSPRGAAKASGLYKAGPIPGCGASLGMLARGLLTTSGNEPAPMLLPTPALSEKTPFKTLKGVPVEKVVMPDHCHPPRSVRLRPDSLKKGRS